MGRETYSGKLPIWCHEGEKPRSEREECVYTEQVMDLLPPMREEYLEQRAKQKRRDLKITVAVAAPAFLLATALFFWWLRRRSKRSTDPGSGAPPPETG